MWLIKGCQALKKAKKAHIKTQKDTLLGDIRFLTLYTIQQHILHYI